MHWIRILNLSEDPAPIYLLHKTFILSPDPKSDMDPKMIQSKNVTFNNALQILNFSDDPVSIHTQHKAFIFLRILSRT